MALQNRMARELRTLEREPPDGVCVLLPDEANPLQLRARLQGPPGSPYEDGLFELDIRIPERYPFEPPKVQFSTPCYHPNIDNKGLICLDLLNPPPKGSWTPALNIGRLLAGLRQLLLEPNPDDPLMADIAEELKHNRSLFEAKARQHTAAHARAPTGGFPLASSQQHPSPQQQQQPGSGHEAGGRNPLPAAADGLSEQTATPSGQAGAGGSNSSQQPAAAQGAVEGRPVEVEANSTGPGAASTSTAGQPAAAEAAAPPPAEATATAAPAADQVPSSRPTALSDITNQVADADSSAVGQQKVAGAHAAGGVADVKPGVAGVHGKQRKRLCLRR